MDKEDGVPSHNIIQLFSSVQSLSHVRLFTTPWTAARQASLSITNCRSLPKLMSSQWCHPTISSSVIPFSSCPQSFPASGSFQMSQLFASGGQNIGVSASTSVLPMNTPDSQESSPTPQFKSINSSALSCREPAWGTPPVAKVIRKEARHTQRRDRASGVPLEILERLPPKTRVCLLHCLVPSPTPLTLWGAVPHHLSLKKS